MSGSNEAEGAIRVGSAVRFREGEGEEVVEIVGDAEADPWHGRISRGSPLARALLGRRPGDEVQVRTPGGVRHVSVVAAR